MGQNVSTELAPRPADRHARAGDGLDGGGSVLRAHARRLRRRGDQDRAGRRRSRAHHGQAVRRQVALCRQHLPQQAADLASTCTARRAATSPASSRSRATWWSRTSSPARSESWGLGWSDLSRANPRLVMVRISGFGQDGPYAARPGYGVICEAVSGLRHLTGDPDRPPSRVGVSMTDYITGLHGAFGAVMALMARGSTGRGQFIDAALYECAFNFMEPWIPAYEKLGHRRQPHRLAPGRQHAQQSLPHRRRRLHPHHRHGRQPVPPPGAGHGPARAGRGSALRQGARAQSQQRGARRDHRRAGRSAQPLAEIERMLAGGRRAGDAHLSPSPTSSTIRTTPRAQLDRRRAGRAIWAAWPWPASCRACRQRPATCAMPAATSARIRARVLRRRARLRQRQDRQSRARRRDRMRRPTSDGTNGEQGVHRWRTAKS